eukprot:TRINITY_DN11527_c0_g1_i1.p1 TRINITY_DN11527_c0_g1~~TRINITY_DN11527_c0_g1_i1.p1  ORF type:complete len:358 (-),score=94.72 TRINITY_DN11527_c0_g1_i1:62-1135(-)
MFENLKKISKIKCPVFIVHGKEDTIIPISHSQKLEKEISDGLLWKFLEIEDAANHDLETSHSDELLDELIAFIEFLAPQGYLESKEISKAPIPKGLAMSPSVVIGMWLKSVQLEQYQDKFLCGGFYDLDTIKTMTPEDLDMIGIEDSKERERILTCVKEINQPKQNNPEPNQSDSDTETESEDEARSAILESIQKLPSMTQRTKSEELIQFEKSSMAPPNSPMIDSSRSQDMDPRYHLLLVNKIKQMETLIASQNEQLFEMTDKLEKAIEIIKSQSEEIAHLKLDLETTINSITLLTAPIQEVKRQSIDSEVPKISESDHHKELTIEDFRQQTSQFEQSYKELEDQLLHLSIHLTEG